MQKFGGTSLDTPEKIQAAARRVVDKKRQGFAVVAVVSAMGHQTDQLLELSRRIHSDPPRRELDVLLSGGERSSSALLAMAIHKLGEEAVSLSGRQCGIITNDVHSNARILEIRPQRVRQELAQGRIVVAAGFQGVGLNGETTTLGRGGSDTTAMALAAALQAEDCQILTDVEGVFSADPRVVPQAVLLERLSSSEMQELAWHGAQVVKGEAVELAHSNDVSFRVRSSFGGGQASRVECLAEEEGEESYIPHRPAVAGVSGRKDLIRIRCRGAPLDGAGPESVFWEISRYDLIEGHLDSRNHIADVYLSTLEVPDPNALKSDLEQRMEGHLEVTLGLGAVTVVGFGIGSRPGSLYEVYRILQESSAGVLHSFSSRQSVSYVIPVERVDECVRLVHRRFVEGSR